MSEVEEKVPKFTLDEPYYETETVWGRFKNNLVITNPKLLLIKTDKVWMHAHIIDKWKRGDPEARAMSDKDLWFSRTVKDSSVNPDNGEIIPRPFRMCGYTAFGTPIVFAMLLPVTANSLYLTAFAQWANQSHNAAVNWCNRSVSEGGDPKMDILRGYSAAVVGAVGIGVGSNMLVDRLKVATSTKALIKRYTPFPAVCAASVVNMCMMRLPEIQRGIKVFDKDNGELVGTSKIAATQAISSTAQVRVVLVACAVLLPAVMYAGCEAAMRLHKPRMAPLRLPVTLVCTVTGFGLGVPLSLSCFTQYMDVPRSSLEPELRKADGSGTVRFNKGM